MAPFETQHENPELSKDLQNLVFQVVQYKLGNLDHADNRETLNEACRTERKSILNSPLFKTRIVPQLTQSYKNGQPYNLIQFYDNTETEDAPYNGFILKASHDSDAEDIVIDLDEVWGEIYPENTDNYLNKYDRYSIDGPLSRLESVENPAVDESDDTETKEKIKNEVTEGIAGQNFLEAFNKLNKILKPDAAEKALAKNIDNYFKAHADKPIDQRDLESHLGRINAMMGQLSNLSQELKNETDPSEIAFKQDVIRGFAINIAAYGDSGREPNPSDILNAKLQMEKAQEAVKKTWVKDTPVPWVQNSATEVGEEQDRESFLEEAANND